MPLFDSGIVDRSVNPSSSALAVSGARRLFTNIRSDVLSPFRVPTTFSVSVCSLWWWRMVRS